VKHISEDDLELYCLGPTQMGSPQATDIEEHLLWCRGCAARAEESASFVDLITIALIMESLDLGRGIAPSQRSSQAAAPAGKPRGAADGDPVAGGRRGTAGRV
jgi:hypothetical protein